MVHKGVGDNGFVNFLGSSEIILLPRKGIYNRLVSEKLPVPGKLVLPLCNVTAFRRFASVFHMDGNGRRQNRCVGTNAQTECFLYTEV